MRKQSTKSRWRSRLSFSASSLPRHLPLAFSQASRSAALDPTAMHVKLQRLPRPPTCLVRKNTFRRPVRFQSSSRRRAGAPADARRPPLSEPVREPRLLSFQRM
jgi:hypothetical protein